MTWWNQHCNKNLKKGQPWSHFLFFFLLKEGGGNRNDGADSTVTVMSSHRNSEVNHDQGPRPKKKKGRGGVCLHGNILHGRYIKLVHQPEEKKKKGKNSMEGSSLWYCLYFFLLFVFFFLKCRFWVVCWCIFFSYYSHQQAWSSHTEKNVYVSSVKMPLKKKNKKELHIYIKKFWGDSTFFWQSSQSSYMSVSRLSFLVICDMISDYWYPQFRFKNVCI